MATKNQKNRNMRDAPNKKEEYVSEKDCESEKEKSKKRERKRGKVENKEEERKREEDFNGDTGGHGGKSELKRKMAFIRSFTPLMFQTLEEDLALGAPEKEKRERIGKFYKKGMEEYIRRILGENPITVYRASESGDPYVRNASIYPDEFYFDGNRPQVPPPSLDGFKEGGNETNGDTRDVCVHEVVRGYLTNIINGRNSPDEAPILVDGKHPDRGWIGRDAVARIFGW